MTHVGIVISERCMKKKLNFQLVLRRRKTRLSCHSLFTRRIDYGELRLIELFTILLSYLAICSSRFIVESWRVFKNYKSKL